MKAIQPKIIIINNCNDCPYAQYGGLSVICRKLKEIGKYDVPYDMDDCPLNHCPKRAITCQKMTMSIAKQKSRHTAMALQLAEMGLLMKSQENRND